MRMDGDWVGRLRPVLRLSLAAMWIATAVVSFGLYPLAQSRALVGTLGIEGTLADLLIFGGAGLDLLLGGLLAAGWRPVWVGAGQLAVMAAFTLMALGLPAEYWLHPLAPLIKNLPIAAATAMMMALEGAACSTRPS